MKRFGTLLLGCAALLAGWTGSFVLQYLPPTSTTWWVLPPLLLGGGLGLLVRTGGWRGAILAAGATGLVATVLARQVWPGALVLPGFGPGVTVASHLRVARLQVPATLQHDRFHRARVIYLPNGWQAQLYARVDGAPRMLARDAAGGVYVSVPDRGEVLYLQGRTADGAAARSQVIASSLDRPHGLLWRPGVLFVAGTTRLYRIPLQADGSAASSAEVLRDDLPDGGHWTRSLADADGRRLYLSIGSSCNVCDENDPRRAAVLLFDPQSGELTPFAQGLRNSVGLWVDKTTGALWGTDNGRDMLGDDLPPDELNRIEAGKDYGWPACYGQRVPDPSWGTTVRCRDTEEAALEIPAHSAALGLTLVPDLPRGDRSGDALVIAYHGSWNRTVPTGYKLVAVPWRDGSPAGPPEDLAVGWLWQGRAWGRPVDPCLMEDGTLLVTDDRAGAIYRLVPPGRGER